MTGVVGVRLIAGKVGSPHIGGDNVRPFLFQVFGEGGLATTCGTDEENDGV